MWLIINAEADHEWLRKKIVSNAPNCTFIKSYWAAWPSDHHSSPYENILQSIVTSKTNKLKQNKTKIKFKKKEKKNERSKSILNNKQQTIKWTMKKCITWIKRLADAKNYELIFWYLCWKCEFYERNSVYRMNWWHLQHSQLTISMRM